MIVTATFDTQRFFTREHVAAVNAYFRREISAAEAAKRMGFNREQWERHMAGIFANGNSDISVSRDIEDRIAEGASR